MENIALLKVRSDLPGGCLWRSPARRSGNGFKGEWSGARGNGVVCAAIERHSSRDPDAVVVGPSNTVVPILKAAHAKGWEPLFVTVSFVGTDELIQEAGAEAEGMVVTQVAPPYYLTDLKTVALYRRSMLKYMPVRGRIL